MRPARIQAKSISCRCTVALGAAAKSARAERVHEGMIGGALAMDAYLFA